MTGNAFSIHPRDFSAGNTAAIRELVADRTRSDLETESIMRSIERYGLDSSIRYFEVSPSEGRLGARTVRHTAWAVRAERF